MPREAFSLFLKIPRLVDTGVFPSLIPRFLHVNVYIFAGTLCESDFQINLFELNNLGAGEKKCRIFACVTGRVTSVSPRRANFTFWISGDRFFPLSLPFPPFSLLFLRSTDLQRSKLSAITSMIRRCVSAVRGIRQRSYATRKRDIVFLDDVTSGR